MRIRRMPSLTLDQQQQIEAQIEAMTKSIVNKIAHGPISELRRNAGAAGRLRGDRAIRKGVSPAGVMYYFGRVA